MQLINSLKVWALIHALNNLDDKKLSDIIEDYQRKEFGGCGDKAIRVTGEKMLRIGLELMRRAQK